MCVMFVSFWQLGNRQILDNFIVPLETRNSIVKSGHSFAESISNIKPFAPDFLPFVMLIVMIIYWVATSCTCFRKKNVNVLQEELVNYFEALNR